MFKSTLYEETHPSSVDFRCKDSKKFLITQINLYFVVILLLLAHKTHFSAPMSFLLFYLFAFLFCSLFRPEQDDGVISDRLQQP